MSGKQKRREREVAKRKRRSMQFPVVHTRYTRKISHSLASMAQNVPTGLSSQLVDVTRKAQPVLARRRAEIAALDTFIQELQTALEQLSLAAQASGPFLGTPSSDRNGAVVSPLLAPATFLDERGGEGLTTSAAALMSCMTFGAQEIQSRLGHQSARVRHVDQQLQAWHAMQDRITGGLFEQLRFQHGRDSCPTPAEWRTAIDHQHQAGGLERRDSADAAEAATSAAAADSLDEWYEALHARVTQMTLHHENVRRRRIRLVMQWSDASGSSKAHNSV